MKKRGLIIPILLSIVIIASLVSAATTPTEALTNFFKGARDIFKGLAEAILGSGPEVTGGGLAARAMIFLIIISVTWSVVEKIDLFRANTTFVALIAIAVSVLATRFLLTPSWVEAILLPYSVFGIAVASFIPIVIYFFFVESINSSILRRAAWILAGVIFVVLWISRIDLVSEATYIYLLAAIACGLFFSFDGTIQKIMVSLKAGKALTAHDYAMYGGYMDQIEKLMKSQKRFAYGSTDWVAVEKNIKDLEKKAKSVLARIKS